MRKSSTVMTRREPTVPAHTNESAQQIDQCCTSSTVNDIPYYTSAQPSPFTRNSQCKEHQDDCQSTHERTLRGGRLLCDFLFTRYVSPSFHPLFHSPGISTWSMCIGACHACTASQCDLRDPGWEDPGFRHCDFFALAPNGPSGDVFGFVLVFFQRMACSVLGTQVAL